MVDSSNTAFADYESVVAEVERVAAHSEEPINPATLANVRDLIAVCRNIGRPVPDSVGRGYWPTILLNWGFVQIEVFDDHLEVYHLREGETSIRQEEHQPGASFSQWFLAELSALGR